MKITRILTYNINENYVRNFFDNEWFKDTYVVDSEMFMNFEYDLTKQGYDGEELIYEGDTKKKIQQIWQEECDKYHKEQEESKIEKEQILKELQYYKDEMKYYKNKIAQLEEWLKDA